MAPPPALARFGGFVEVGLAVHGVSAEQVQHAIEPGNGGYGLLGGVEEASGKEVEQQFATNVFGLLNVARAVLPHMRRAGRGHVVNISAIAGSDWNVRVAYRSSNPSSGPIVAIASTRGTARSTRENSWPPSRR